MRRLLLLLLLRAYPPPFRGRFGDEVVAQALEEIEAAHALGPVRGVAAFASIALDMVRSGALERLRPTWRASGRTLTRSETMTMMMGSWLHELRIATRTLPRSPGFLAATVLTLALALGVNAGIFTVVDAVLLRPLPFPESDRLVYVAARAPGTDLPEEFGVSPEFYLTYRDRAHTLDGVAVFNSFTASLRVGDRVERVRMSAPSPSLFETLGARPILGRLPDNDDVMSEMVISHATWQDWFGGDAAVLGRVYEAMGGSRTIVGVMGPDFVLPVEGVHAWIPNEFRSEEVVPGRFGLPLVARLAEGVDREDAAAELGALARRLPEEFGGSAAYRDMIDRHIPVVRPLDAQLFAEVAPALWTLMAGVGIVLLIACANVANLFAVRASGRGRDIAVRRAMGAGRHQLVRTQLAEALIIAVVAGIVALPLAWITLPAFLAVAPEGLPRVQDLRLSSTTLLFTAVAAVVAALACGLGPALRASASSLDRLRDQSRGTTSSRNWGRDVLVVGQCALALVLLVGSGLLLRSFAELRDVDPGYDTEDLLTFQFAPEEAHLVDGPSWAEFHLDMLNRLEAMPGIEATGIVENVPMDEGLRTMRFRDGSSASADDAALLSMTWAGGGYFEAAGIEILRGRGFTAEDARVPGRAVISQAAADMLWPGENPVGRTLRGSTAQGAAASPDDEQVHTVVGVVENILQYDMAGDSEPLVYYPMIGPTPDAWSLSSPGYVVRTDRPEEVVPAIRALIADVAPSAPMYRVHTIESLLARSMAELTFTMVTLATVAGLAVLLSAIGLYGILSYVVSARTQEIGVRMALGAEAGRVRRMVVARGARVVGVGVVLGVAAAAFAGRALQGFLFGVETVDPPTLAAVAAAMLVVGLLASYVPARRASRVDPLTSMRG